MIVCVFSIGCDGRTVVHGHVVDEDGSPIPGATVKLGRYAATSLDDGSFNVDSLHGWDQLTLVVKKDGFASEDRLMPRGVHNDVGVVLKREAE